MSNNEIDLMNEDSRTNKFRRERTVVQFGGNTKYGANIDYEEPQQMVFNDVLNLEEKYKEQTKEDIEFDVDDITTTPQDYVELEGEDMMLFERLMGLLNDCDDVDEVYHNVSNYDEGEEE